MSRVKLEENYSYMEARTLMIEINHKRIEL